LLRANFELEVIQTEEQQFYEFNNALHDSVLMGFIDLQRMKKATRASKF
jgi:hypothetical protein